MDKNKALMSNLMKCTLGTKANSHTLHTVAQM